MGVLCFARGAFTSATKYSGRFVCVTFLSGVTAPAGVRVRRYSQRQVPGQYVCYHLPHRTLLKIQGQDTSPFLQGIITNDMGLLVEPGLTAVYSHMLNVQGRTLYDIMLYRYSNTSLMYMLSVDTRVGLLILSCSWWWWQLSHWAAEPVCPSHFKLS